MAVEISQEQMQSKISTARRDAEGLKEKIKRRKDELADSSREYTHTHDEKPDERPDEREKSRWWTTLVDHVGGISLVMTSCLTTIAD